tara:strand:- start:1064 stop:1354 length:291 start_codon:yes stop_codon:yes gene_type:complete
MNLNIYGNKFGFHNPKFAEKVYNILKKDINIIDTSWHNDLADSFMVIDTEINISIPNSKIHNPNEELFNSFYITTHNNNLLETKSIEEVINYVKNR